MSVLEEKRNSSFRRARRNAEALLIKSEKQLFKVVVNNYKQKETESLDKKDEELLEKTEYQKGLPPQPTGYLKFPDYDWF